MTKIKICGLKTEEDIKLVNAYRPEYCGFIFWEPGKRYITPDKAAHFWAEGFKYLGINDDIWQQEIDKFKQDKDTLKLREERFNSFHKENTRFSKEYRTAESLRSSQMDYDVYVAGSDQVWNPNNYTSLDHLT